MKRPFILVSLTKMNGESSEMLDILRGAECYAEAEELASIISLLKSAVGNRVRIDFSVINDTKYYNGVVFKGFIKGIPQSVLSGGRYDSLMSRMGKKSGAIGFAVYLDLVDELDADTDEYDCDVFLLYGENTSICEIAKKADSLTLEGKRVRCGQSAQGISYRSIIEI